MGLAASQARFLNLVAKKTNIEFEAQQINQQRTALANQSANYYNAMLALQVPTPPSTSTYKRTIYSVNIGSQQYNISQLIATAGNKYSIAYSTTQATTAISETSAKGYQITYSAGKYYHNGQEAQSVDSLDLDATAIASIKAQMKDIDADSTAVYYIKTGTDVNPKYVYFNNTALDDVNTPGSGMVNGYTSSEVEEFVEGSWTDATITRDSNNTIVAIQVPGLADNKQIAVTSTSINDETAYAEAYNEYTYQTYLYQQQLENANAQTSVVQAKDKKLELRLKQLDTEQNAISTEMESISGVIKKNVEDSFKTFA